MNKHQFSYGFNSGQAYELDVFTHPPDKNPSIQLDVHDAFSIGGVRRTVHAWEVSRTGPHCDCVELTGQCPLPLHQVLAIQPAAHRRKYYIGTARRAGGDITGLTGELRVGSGGLGDGDGDGDGDRHR